MDLGSEIHQLRLRKSHERRSIPFRSMSLLLNDVHSQLNPTRVACLRLPVTVDELRATVREAAAQGLKISLAGGRHAMGGQQFAEGSMHIDMTALCRVVETDAERGLLHIEAGAEWPAIIAASHGMRSSTGVQWGIRQKQTGVDAVSIGGSVSVNAHGRSCGRSATMWRGSSS
jgi:FAD/FMN-containing dehydrogenase